MKAWIPLAGLAVLGAAALAVPLRHRVRLETAPGNPVQRIVLESRSLAGLTRTAWGASAAGAEVWGSPEEGFFLAPAQTVQVTVEAWPRFRRTLTVQPGEGAAAAPLPAWDAA
ncbi:MAG TPA: hypothetical protein PKO12_11590, partial [Holophaga sp.]|nr:hypothetical protein [Holophaga sp.]